MNSIRNPSANELLLKEKVRIDCLKVFGCIAYVHIRKEIRTKEDGTALKMIYIGNTPMSYLFLDVETVKTMCSIDCEFKEDEFYGEQFDFIEDVSNDHDEASSSLRTTARHPAEAG